MDEILEVLRDKAFWIGTMFLAGWCTLFSFVGCMLAEWVLK